MRYLSFVVLQVRIVHSGPWDVYPSNSRLVGPVFIYYPLPQAEAWGYSLLILVRDQDVSL